MSFDEIPETRNIINVLSAHQKDDNYSELHIAIKENNVELVEKLLENNVCLNYQTNNGITSLLLSCLLPVNKTIPKKLIQSGADVNIPDNVNFTPLLAACKLQNLEIVKLLLSNGANINHQDDCEYTALHYAIENDDLDLVDLLLESGADTSLADCNGWNPLMMALHVHEPCAERILPFTKDVNAVAFNGWSALMLAASNVSKDIIMELVEQGADVNINVDGVMPVTLTLERSDPSIFDYLWDLTDIEVLKDEDELLPFLEALITSDWVTPSKVRYFYKVIDTPGVELNSGGYFRMLANYMAELDTQEEYLAIDVYGIMKKIFQKDTKIIDLDIEGFISLCYRYDFDYKYKLLQLLLEHNADFNHFHYSYMCLVNDPEFILQILPYCTFCPLFVMNNAINTKRVDIPMLKLIKSFLMLCTPTLKIRENCVKRLQSSDIIHLDCYCYAILISSLEYPYKKYIKHDFTAREREILPKLYNEVLDLLSRDSVPSLKELSRDRIRKCLASNSLTTQDYLNNLAALHLPKFMIDIIQCKSAVCSFD